MINSSCIAANDYCMAVKMKYTVAQIKVLIRMLPLAMSLNWNFV